MQRWKSRGGKSQRGEVKKWEDQRRERVGSKKMQVREKVGKSRFTMFFQWFGAPEGWKVTLLKRQVRSQLARWEMKNCTPLWREAHSQKCQKPTVSDHFWVQMSKKCTSLWREAHFQVKSVKNLLSQTTFGSSDVEKVHVVVARSTFPSQKCQRPSVSDHFWKFRCGKSARCCGAKHISKSKVSKTYCLRPLLEVQMSKKCMSLWREAHFQVNSVKNLLSQTTFGSSDVEKVHIVVARSKFPSQKCQKLRVWAIFWRSVCRPPPPPPPPQQQQLLLLLLLLQLQSTLKDTTLTTTTTTTTTTLHYTTLHKTTLHYTILHYITLDPLHPYNMPATTLHYLHYITTTTPPRYNYDYSCSTPHYIQQLWERWPLQPL